MPKKLSNHLGAGLLVGAAIGVAAAAFLQTKKGKQLAGNAQKKIGALQKKIAMEVKKSGVMNKEQYQALVEKIVAYYVKTKEVAQKEVPAVRKALLSSWKNVEQGLRSAK